MKFNTGYRYGDLYSKKEFYDKALIYLRDEFLCPPYIFDEATFSEVNKIDIPIITAEGSATINYTRLLGYDKQVAYTTKKPQDILMVQVVINIQQAIKLKLIG